jgi:putative peptidoglycan lipid II flippase
MRGGLIIGIGILAGNVLGFVRGAVTAYLLGTGTIADAMAVAMGPIDTLNYVLTNTMVFAFVPLLAARQGSERAHLFRRTARLFTWVFCSLSVALIVFAPQLTRILGPGLSPSVFPQAVNILRISAISTLATGAAALHAALLMTERRFGPSAFYQASLNLLVIVGALVLWKTLGVYAFAAGYVAGACTQFLLVSSFARRSWRKLREEDREYSGGIDEHSTAELLSKPGAFLVYAILIALNVIVTRAYATHAGPGMAAAFDYCIRCVNVVVAYLISPTSNTLLPEIALLRSEKRAHDAFRLINHTLAVAAGVSVAAYLVGLMIRNPVIAILFQRGSFTAESTSLVSAVFVGFAPSLIGLSLLEIASRGLFALDRPALPVIAACVPVTVNLALSWVLRPTSPELIGLGASVGLLAGFAFLFAAVSVRRRAATGELASARS